MPYTLKPNKFWVKNPNAAGYLPQNVVTDATTAEQVAALEARAAEIEAAWPADYSDLTEDVNGLNSALDINAYVSNLTTYGIVVDNKVISSTDGTLSTEKTYKTTDYIPVTAGEMLYGKGCKRYYYYDANKDGLTGTGRTGFLSSAPELVAGSDIRYITVPESAAYIRISIKKADFDSAFAMRPSGYDRYLKNNVTELTNKIFPQSLPYSLTDGSYILYSSGGTNSSADFRYTDYIDISAYDNIVYKRIKVTVSSPAHGMAFYDTNKDYISGVQSIKNGNAPSFEYSEIAVPENAVYARFSWWSQARQDAQGDGDFIVCSTDEYNNSIYAKANNQSASVSALVPDVPQSEGVQNAILTARQFTDIEWTPVADMPGIYRDPKTNAISYKTHKKGCRQKGIPYGSGINYGRRVGYAISFDAFATAVFNPNSVLYTENTYSDGGKMAAYYGVACSKLVQACWGAPELYDSQVIYNMPGLTKIADAGNYTVDDIQLGDGIINPSVHCTICTGIFRDTKGNVQAIEISEAVMPTCRRLVWSVNEFYDHFDTYQLYRYTLIDNATYKKAKYVDVDDGITGEKDLPIAIRRGSYINVSSTDSNHPVYADVDNTRWTTLHDIVNGEDVTKAISSSEIIMPRSRTGYHEVYPTDANGNRGNSSYYFSYAILVSGTVSEGSVTVTWESNMEAYAIAFRSYYEYIEEDTGTVTAEIPSGATTCRILFRSDYGTVESSTISLT